MRLLFVTSIFPSPYHPTRGVFNLALARALADDHDVQVLSPLSWTDEWTARRKGERAIGAGRREVLSGIPVEYPRYFYSPKFFREHYHSFMWQSVRSTARRLLNSFQPDAVLSYWAHPDGAVATRLAREAGIPGIVMVGGSDVLLFTKDQGRRRCILKVLHEADALITVSRNLTSKLNEFGVPQSKVHLVERGIDAAVFHPGSQSEARRRLGIPTEGRAVVWVGRMVPVKGLDVLMESCELLQRSGVSFRLYLVGDGELRKSLELDARDRGLADKIHFVGAVQHDDLADWYRAADLTVLPSRSEGVPNVLRESLACGTPFVASRVGGIPEIAQDQANRLVPVGDAAALASALREALTGPKPLVTSPTADWSKAARLLSEVIRPLVGRKHFGASAELQVAAADGRYL